MVRRTPQEKKRLSYAKDRRNTYGENPQSSRRNITRNRQHAHRANRHAADQALREALGVRDEAVAERAENTLRAARPKRFRKAPDTPLGEVVASKLRRRAEVGMFRAAEEAQTSSDR
ncbi:hypothetical protein [Saccharothrix variisporea]|uniref:Uncharacterized protein n=1 Tax=Saccharothrix variisporea TaxID=543527 RepID=A0A495X5C3_9PSEU|nr:hypothetical protein [Saccharothrix variisporea]RKT68736.1 hypothetical protein DFJ66_1929 [Saccharothrix variisporea]